MVYQGWFVNLRLIESKTLNNLSHRLLESIIKPSLLHTYAIIYCYRLLLSLNVSRLYVLKVAGSLL